MTKGYLLIVDETKDSYTVSAAPIKVTVTELMVVPKSSVFMKSELVKLEEFNDCMKWLESRLVQ